MKKLLSIALIAATLLTTLVFAVPTTAETTVETSEVTVTSNPVAANTKIPSPDVLNGYENICLTYHFNPDIGTSVRQNASDLLPYVAYLVTERKVQDFFFDSYLFLPWNASAPSGATLHGGTNNPTIASDWTAYIDDAFYNGKNVDALDTAMGQAKAALNDTTKKAGVFFTILYPAHNQTNFGSLGGKTLDLSKQADREYAIKWMIDEQIKRFNDKGYENLDLVGFYWLEEEIYSNYDAAMMQYASEYLHSKGLKFIWIPWFQAPGYNKWKTYGFDLACLQPNEIWQSTSIPNRVNTCASLCDLYGMSMQIKTRHESSEKVFFDRYMRYLYGGMVNGHMDSVKFYYQDGKTGVYYASCYSKEPLFRSVYDLTYKYAKGTLTEDDIDLGEAPAFSVPNNVEWVSQGKTYTGCQSYTDGNGMPYQNVDGKELTDGVLGNTTNGTEWHAYHISILDDEGRMSSTIDLGEVYTGLTHVMAPFRDYQPFNIGAPSDVKIYTSEDGTNFKLLTTATIKHSGDFYYFKYIPTTPFDARYVKMSFTNTTGYNFVFCSEFFVGKVKEVADDPSPDVSDPSDNSNDNSNDSSNDSSDDTSGDVSVEDPDIGDLDHTHVRTDNWEYDDNTHWFVCECGMELNVGVHIPGNWKVTVQPTIETEGVKERRCYSCGKLMAEGVVPKIPYAYGDVNRNNSIDSLDYVFIKRNYFGTYTFDEQQLVIADINNSGVVDSMDYVLAKRIYFGTYKK